MATTLLILSWQLDMIRNIFLFFLLSKISLWRHLFLSFPLSYNERTFGWRRIRNYVNRWTQKGFARSRAQNKCDLWILSVLSNDPMIRADTRFPGVNPLFISFLLFFNGIGSERYNQYQELRSRYLACSLIF